MAPGESLFFAPKMKKIDVARLKILMTYDPLTGLFTRNLPIPGSAKVGDVAGCRNKKGYVIIKIDGRGHMAHRLAWLYSTGSHPKFVIDHKNRVTNDNRLENLRPATLSQNSQNSIRRKDNTTGYKGVTWHKSIGKFTARIMFEKKHINLGVFDDPVSAYNAYCAAAKKYHGDFARF